MSSEAEDREAMARDGLVDEDRIDVRKANVTFREGVRDIGVPPTEIPSLLESVQSPTSTGGVAEAPRLPQRAQAAALLAVDKRRSINALIDDNDLIDRANVSISDTSKARVAAEHHREPRPAAKVQKLNHRP